MKNIIKMDDITPSEETIEIAKQCKEGKLPSCEECPVKKKNEK